MTQSLDQALLDAHARDDRVTLIELYTQAADTAENEHAVGFYLTHAYVFALEAGDIRAVDLRHRLVALGRDTDPPDNG